MTKMLDFYVFYLPLSGYNGYTAYEDEESFVFDRASKGKNIYLNRYNDTSKRFRGTLHLFAKWKVCPHNGHPKIHCKML